MTVHDDDILDFDFVDDETREVPPPARQSGPRPPGGGPTGGGGRPPRTLRGPNSLTPLLRLAGLVALAGFELDPPHLVARLYAEGPAPVLAAQFGARNPEGYLQYVRLEGERRIHLLSRFVGEEWTKALDGSLDR